MNDATAPRTHHHVIAGGHRLAVDQYGDVAGKAPVLVFLHEGLGSIAQWRRFPAALGQRCGLPVLVYDRWGFGGSAPLALPRPDDYLRREAEEALPELLAALGVQRPILYGHSDGGSIALLYASAFPEHPLACVTEAAHVFVEAESLAGIREAAQLWRDTDLPERLARYHGDQAETVFRGWAETWLRPSFRPWRMTDRLPGITCPCLVTQGADDQYGTREQVAAIVEGCSGPAQSLILPDCAHAPHREARDAMFEAVEAFLRPLL